MLAVGNGAIDVGAPNGSTVGIASEAALRDTLTCPYSCWAHANFQPASLLRRLIERASRQLSPTAPLTCAHLRTMCLSRDSNAGLSLLEPRLLLC